MPYTVNHFIDTFHKYSNACAEKGYIKLEYSIWREINNCLKREGIIIRLKYDKMLQGMVLSIITTRGQETIFKRYFPKENNSI